MARFSLRKSIVRHVLPVAAAAALLMSASGARAAIIVTLGDPKAEFANFTGPNGVCSVIANSICDYGTETFAGWKGGGFTSTFTDGQNNFTSGVGITGTYSGAISYDTNNTYGGAYGTQPYPSANGLSSYTLNLTTEGIPGVNYIGVWITAMDASNLLSLYSDGSQVFNFASSDLKAAIAQTANPSAYYGNPDNGRDPSEPFAYVNIFDTSGFFSSVQFSNSSGSNFESSNHAVGYFNPLNVNGTPVAITTNTLAVTTAVDEPAGMALMAVGIGATLLARRRLSRAVQTA